MSNNKVIDLVRYKKNPQSNTTYIQDVSGGPVNILGCGSINYSE
jgi:hypothetical protein